MNQNTSPAVMQQRHEAHDSLDDFPTPPWAGRALVEHVIAPNYTAWSAARDGIGGNLRDGIAALQEQTVWEPASNRGYLVRALRPYFETVRSSDIHDYGVGASQRDFLMPYTDDGAAKVDWIITNPPFRLAEQFIQRALDLAVEGVAMLCRSAFTEGQDRYLNLFSKNPPTYVAHFAERVVMWRGKCVDPEVLIWSEKQEKMVKPTSATAYAWFVWMQGEADSYTRWIPPCRKQLEQPGDYEVAA